ncbi:MAG: sigma-54-dependent Fis family transcriptional regulator [Candidatus Schekmanbacteria bacterium]|nr:sigma-54-dependent Fis family transcriptional regulator [Candidatus Schekmanbacteria bacterium]
MKRDRPTTNLRRALALLHEAITALSDRSGDSKQTLRDALDQLMAVTESDAGAICVPGEESDDPRLIVQRQMQEGPELSRTVLRPVLAGRNRRSLIDAVPESASVAGAVISSTLCVPVCRAGKTIGAVYLDRRGLDRFPYDREAADVAECFAATLALAVDLRAQLELAEKREDSAWELAAEARELACQAGDYWRLASIKTENRAFAQCLRTAERAARNDTDILILGETGVGKGYLARCIYETSLRKGGAFIVVQCSNLPETLVESELFGYEPGAFTDARQQRIGKVERAHGGVLFLDEIGDLPLGIQAKLLGLLEERTFYRLGGARPVSVDIQIIAATNRNLVEAVENGNFRSDLYYRINVVPVTIPPLRERPEDISDLVQTFFAQAAVKSERAEPISIDRALVRRLAVHRWPGNVRELRNAIKRLVVLADGPRITVADAETYLFASQSHNPGSSAPTLLPGKSLKEQVDELEKALIEQALARTGSLTAAAELLGIRRQTLAEKLRKHEHPERAGGKRDREG